MDSREKINRLFFDKIKTSNLGQEHGLVLEIDSTDYRVETNKLSASAETRHEKFIDSLPYSLSTFIRLFSNGIIIDIGNLIRVDSVDGEENMEFWTKEYLSYDSFPAENLIAFGSNGAGEVFGFLKDIETHPREFPIVWMDPGGYDEDGFVFINSSFDRFITIQYYMLKAIDNEELYEELEDEEIERTGIDLEDDEWQSFQDFLYNRFDPTILKPKTDLFESAKTLSEVINEIDQYKSNYCQQKI